MPAIFCCKIFSENSEKGIDNTRNAWYNILVRQGTNPLREGSEEMEKGMTNAQFNAFLETLAKLIESKAKTPEEAAEIVREAKTK